MPSRDELREELAELKFSGYSQCLIQLNDRELDLVMSLIDQQIREAEKRTYDFIESELMAAPKDSWHGTLKECGRKLSTKPLEREQNDECSLQ